MNPTPSQILESMAWADMLESLTQSYFDRFVATPQADVVTLLRLRDHIEVLRDIDRELHDMARSTT